MTVSFKSQSDQFFAKLIVGGMGTCLLIVAFLVFVVAKLFEYSLYSIFGKDVPWYLDLLGGCLLNGFNFPIAAACLIARSAGFEAPFVP